MDETDIIETMQWRAPSPLGAKRQKFGRKALVSSRMAASIEHRSPQVTLQQVQKSQKRLLNPHYTFRRWHAFAVLVCLIVVIGGTFAYGQVQHTQAVAQKKQADEKQKVEAAAAEERQACYQTVVSTNPTAVGKMTYDELYGARCS